MIIDLNSVGCVIDNVNGNTYPQGTGLDEMEMTNVSRIDNGDWWDALDKDDLKIVNDIMVNLSLSRPEGRC